MKSPFVILQLVAIENSDMLNECILYTRRGVEDIIRCTHVLDSWYESEGMHSINLNWTTIQHTFMC